MSSPELDLIDSHCHLTFDVLAADLSAVLNRAKAAGVRRCVTVGTTIDDTRTAVRLASRLDDVWATAGVHPHEAAKTDETTWSDLAAILRAGGAVAVGETGFDYHYDFSDRESQRRAFTRQIVLAEQFDLPLVIHCREAVDEALDLLAACARRPARGVFHCFTGTRDEASRILDAGWHISLSGIVTFRNASNLRRAAEIIPPERLLLETDAPFNSPEPVRKIRTNEPAHLVHTCRFLANLYGVTPTDLANRCNAAAARLFDLS
jgi:TatD DNase family protein